jgi:hypothetical protein
MTEKLLTRYPLFRRASSASPAGGTTAATGVAFISEGRWLVAVGLGGAVLAGVQHLEDSQASERHAAV